MKASCFRFSSCSSTRISLCHRQQKSNWNEPSGAPCHKALPASVLRQQNRSQQKGRSPARSRRWIPFQSFMYAVLLSIFLCSIGANAENVLSTHKKLGQEELIFDRREPPPLPTRLDANLGGVFDRRDDNPNSGPIDSSRDESTQQPQIPLPTPFDSNIGNNFTSTTCPAFFQSFLNDQAFKNCLPLSLLLQTSTSFFTIQRSSFRLTETLDATCHVDYEQCKTTMSTLAQRIQLNEHCGEDLRMQNPIVEEAYNGFMAYRPLHDAGCLRDADGEFCFAKAVSDPQSSSSSFIYYMPLGVSLPGNSQPACNSCLRNTMSVFANYASDSSQPLSTDYLAAAQQIDMQCGPQFVESSVPNTSAGEHFARRNDVGLLATVLCLFYFFS